MLCSLLRYVTLIYMELMYVKMVYYVLMKNNIQRGPVIDFFVKHLLSYCKILSRRLLVMSSFGKWKPIFHDINL